MIRVLLLSPLNERENSEKSTECKLHQHLSKWNGRIRASEYEKYFRVNFIRVYLINDEHISFRNSVKRKLFRFLCTRMSFHDFYISYSLDSENIYLTCIYIHQMLDTEYNSYS